MLSDEARALLESTPTPEERDEAIARFEDSFGLPDEPTELYEPPEIRDGTDLIDLTPTEMPDAGIGHPTESPAPYRELAFEVPEPVHATPTPPPMPSRTPTTYPPTPRRGVASIFVGIPRDPGEVTSELVASPEAAPLSGSQAATASGAGGLPRIVRVEPTMRDRIVSIDVSVGQMLGIVARLNEVAELIEKRDAHRYRAEKEAHAHTTAELASQWRITRTASMLLGHPHSGRMLALATYMSGAATMAILDYLGLESEPLFELLRLVMGVH